MKIKRFFKFVIVFFLIAGWLFGGYAPSWQNHSLAPSLPLAQAATVETFTSSTSWTAPTGVTSVTVEVWGAGGGGGGMNQNSDGGGGGGGGAYSQKVVTVTPGNGYTVTVGTGGTGNAGCTASTAGGDSWFANTATILAKGGQPGVCSTGTPPAGGLGGAAGSGVGDVKWSGGQGEKGRNSSTGRGGYGGSSAGTGANGWSGPQTWSTATYPTANTPAGGGHGGNGGNSNGTAGSAPASGNGGGGGGSAEGTNIKGGNGAGGKVVLTYNKPPIAPSQDSPLDLATNVSVTPTFLMTAVDGDAIADNLSYKVTIYSNAGCSTLVQENDQAISAAGWTGTDASCANAPNACYLSGTQASFLTQTPLAYGTTYYWRASAKDPDGSGNFTDSATCHSFTTLNPTISVAISDGDITYGNVSLGSSSSTLAGEANDTQSVTNDGDITEDFNIKGRNTDCPWILSASAGSEQYVHEFSLTAGPPWTALTTAYQTLMTGVPASSSIPLDLKITVPTATVCGTSQNVSVTVQAVQTP